MTCSNVEIEFHHFLIHETDWKSEIRNMIKEKSDKIGCNLSNLISFY